MLAPLRSGAFRFALALAVVFSLGSVGLLWMVRHQIDGYGMAATSEMLHAEADILTGAYATKGRAGLMDALARRGHFGHDGPFHYLLTDAGGTTLFGDIPPGEARLGAAQIQVRDEEGLVTMRQLGLRLGDGARLTIATDAFDIDTLRARLARFTLLCGGAITLFALIGGYLVGRIFLGRLDAVNRQVERIVDGSSKARLPAIGLAPEFNTLTRNLNNMLDRIDAAVSALRQVSTAVAHDLRTPLMRLQQRLEAMAERGEEAAEAMEPALAEIEGILETFQALLRIGTIEGGMGRARFAGVDLSGHLARMHETYAPVADDAGQVLGMRVAPGITVHGDADLLDQLFINLVENAIVHTPPGTHIDITLDRHEGGVRACVRDDGPGIVEGEQAKIFQRFYRGAGSRGLPGTGLGLALVAAIAELHGATCRVAPASRGLAMEVIFPGELAG
jgi:signal transduction histidine kinase